MKILNGNILYDFTVAKIDAIEDVNEFQIEFRYRKFQSPSQTPEFEEQRSIRCCRDTTQSFMASVLQEFNVPETTRVDLATHFNFYLDRLSRRSSNRGGSIHVSVSLDVKEISPQRAAAIGRRRERERESERTSRRVMVEAAMAAVTLPAKKSVVESLERERVVAVDDERECAICLEKFGGVEGIELPCLHIYHKDCIIQWLGRNHFCPFCRFKLPC